jgi:hypothetical protein
VGFSFIQNSYILIKTLEKKIMVIEGTEWNGMTQSKATDRLVVINEIVKNVLNNVEVKRLKSIEVDWEELEMELLPNFKVEFYDHSSIELTPEDK